MLRNSENNDYMIFFNEEHNFNYQEASIFLEEGTNNEKFDYHPKDIKSLPAYFLVHSKWFNYTDVFASMIVFLLGFIQDCEETELNDVCYGIPNYVFGLIEVFCLTVISIQYFMKISWFGWRSLLREKRTMLKGVTLIGMMIEVFVDILTPNTRIYKVGRVFRVLLILDTNYFGEVRRKLREILRSLPQILDIIGLLLFIILIYSLLGFYLFGPTNGNEGSPDFQNFILSFVNMFVLLTTSNFPDIMMPLYKENCLSFLFFFSYLIINTYLMMNIVLAVVYDTFTTAECKKFKKLFLHKREACQHAFKLLVSRDNMNFITFPDFCGLMTFLSPSDCSPISNLIRFKKLNQSKTGHLSLKEFYNIYDVLQYRWQEKSQKLNSERSCFGYQSTINKIVKSSWFNNVIFIILILNTIFHVLEALFQLRSSDLEDCFEILSITFILLYLIEMILKLIGLGVIDYCRDLWNVFDGLITILGLISVPLELIYNTQFLLAVRPMRIFRPVASMQRFREIFETFVMIFDRLKRSLIIFFLIYYIFGVIGVELFQGYNLENCCHNTSVESAFSTEGGYYLNNFSDLPRAYVTLFELMVVNNWNIIMEGFAIVVGDWSRIFFMIYYLFTMVVLTIIVSLILESLLLMINSKKKLSSNNKEFETLINLQKEELEHLLRNTPAERNSRYWYSPIINDDYQDIIQFEGKKTSNKEDLFGLLHPEKIKEWTEEAERIDNRRVSVIQQQSHQLINIFGSTSDVRMTLNRQLLSSRSSTNRHRYTAPSNLTRSFSLV